MKKFNLNQLVSLTCYDLPTLASRNRKIELVVSRALIYEQLVGYMSLASAGKVFNRDHTTVIHSVKMLANLRETKTPEHLYFMITEFDRKLSKLREVKQVESEEIFIYKSLVS
jgi:hypothetical protein